MRSSVSMSGFWLLATSVIVKVDCLKDKKIRNRGGIVEICNLTSMGSILKWELGEVYKFKLAPGG